MIRKIVSLLFFASFCIADSTTPRSGLVITDINSLGWGVKLNNNYSIIDASMCIQGVSNTFTSTNTFNQAVIIGSGYPLRFKDSSTHYVQFKSSATTGTVSWVLPANDGSNGQSLTTDGNGNLAFTTVSGGGGGSLPLPAGATNYIQVSTGPLQTGATFYVSSGAISGNLFVHGTGESIFDTGVQASSFTLFWPPNGVNTTNLFVTGATTYLTNAGSSANSLSFGANTSNNIFVIRGNNTALLPFLTNTILGTDANGVIISTTISSNTNLASTQTWTGQNNWTTPAPSTFTYGLVVGSFTINGSSAGQVNMNEGLAASVSSTSAGHDTFWADSSSHAISANFNASVSSYTFLTSSVTPVAGQFPIWLSAGPNLWVVGSSVPAGSGGGGGGSVGGNIVASTQTNMAYYSSVATNTLSGTAFIQVNTSSLTVTSSMVVTNNGQSVGTPSLVNIFGSFAAATDIFSVGSTATSPLFEIQANNPVRMLESGASIGNLQIGGRSDGDNVGDAFSLYEIPNTSGGQGIKIYDGSKNLDLFTANVGQGGNNGSFNFIVGATGLYGSGGTTEVTISSQQVTISTAVTMTSSLTVTTSILASTVTPSIGIVGTVSGSSAPVGDYGEYISTYGANVLGGASNAWTSIATMTLTAGDWDLTANIVLIDGSSVVGASFGVAIWSNANNVKGDQVLGDNQLGVFPPTTTNSQASATISGWRRDITTTTTYYCKGEAFYSTATPTWDCRMSARRMR